MLPPKEYIITSDQYEIIALFIAYLKAQKEI